MRKKRTKQSQKKNTKTTTKKLISHRSEKTNRQDSNFLHDIYQKSHENTKNKIRSTNSNEKQQITWRIHDLYQNKRYSLPSYRSIELKGEIIFFFFSSNEARDQDKKIPLPSKMNPKYKSIDRKKVQNASNEAKKQTDCSTIEMKL